MAFGPADSQFNGDEAIFTDANQRDWRGDTRQDAFANHATFIQHQFECNAPALQKRSYLERAFVAADFLVMAIRDVDSPFGLDSLCQQHLDGFQDTDNGRLV